MVSQNSIKKMCVNKIIFIFFIFNFVYCNEAARILAYFPFPSISHQVVFRPLMQELARRGHELVIITADPFLKGQNSLNITEIDVHDISYGIWREFLENHGSEMRSDKSMQKALSIVLEIIDKQMETEEVKALLRKKEKYDLLFLEACMHPALEITQIVKAPTIQISSFSAIYPNYEVLGAPQHFLLYPEFSRTKLYNLTIWDKIQQIYNEISVKYHYWNLFENYNGVLKKRWGPNAPTLMELANNVDMLFLNMHPLWEGNRPVPPGVIHLNALHMKPEQDLPKDLKSYLDSSVNGVIYMSLGTNVKPSSLSPGTIQMFLKVFSKLPYNVLLKWDADLQNVPENVKVSKWLPQSDLLKHPKVKLFITQAGLQSTDEAILAGVPLIAFPMLGDQWFNAEKYVYYKIGVHLDMETVTEEVLDKSIRTVINDESYRRNMVTLRTWMYDQPQTSLERAVWWTEYVIRHRGAKHYRAPAANITWSEFLMLDIVFTLLFGLILIVTLATVALTYTFRRIFGNFIIKTKIKKA